MSVTEQIEIRRLGATHVRAQLDGLAGVPADCGERRAERGRMRGASVAFGSPFATGALEGASTV